MANKSEISHIYIEILFKRITMSKFNKMNENLNLGLGLLNMVRLTKECIGE
jgi:hypothetical protein